MKTSLLSALVVVLGLGFAQKTSAEEVRLYFTGTVMGSTDDTIAVGSPITGIIVYDSDATPVETYPIDGTPYQAVYPGISLSISIAGYTADMSTTDIVVTNDGPWGSQSQDAFGFSWNADQGIVNESFSESLQSVNMELESHFSEGTGPLSSFDLPLSLDLWEFQFMHSISISGTNEFGIDGVVESVVRDYDADSDGVRDLLDQCSDSPAGKPMKANGCVEGDYNNDGNVDGSDLSNFAGLFGM